MNQLSSADQESADQERLLQVLTQSRHLLVLTGAGCSTPSGISDYRDAAAQWKRPALVQHKDFMGSLAWRQRYWARSQVGYPEFLRAQPNAAHTTLAALERSGLVFGLITQNVDGLHQQAGHKKVIDLHGRLDQVVCMQCSIKTARAEVQQFLDRHNQALYERVVGLAPDGDADISGQNFDHIVVPQCQSCDGILKPDVVFYGDSVPKDVVQTCYSWVDRADALLVVGSSLMVYSSFRFVRKAYENQIPIVAINQGKTRADELLSAKVQGDCAGLLPQIAASILEQ